MPDDQKSKKLVEIIAEELGIDPKFLTDGSSLFHDHGVAGLDGAGLLDAIAIEFGIDMNDVAWGDYFGEELAYNPIYHLICLFRGKKLDHDIVRLEISDLKKTVETGVWQEPKQK